MPPRAQNKIDKCHLCQQPFRNKDRELERCSNCKRLSAWCVQCAQKRVSETISKYNCETPAERIKPEDMAVVGSFRFISSYPSDRKAIENQAREIEQTNNLYKQFIDFLERKPVETKAKENTYCVSLMRKGAAYETYLSYNLPDAAAPLVRRWCKNEDTEGMQDERMKILEADPAIYYHRASQTHFLLDAPPYSLQPKSSSAKGAHNAKQWGDSKNLRLIGTVAFFEESNQHRHMRNYHHAEMRALTYAHKHGYQIIAIMPSRPCCAMCHYTLQHLNLLVLVPPELRGTSASLISDLRSHIETQHAMTNSSTISMTTEGR